jgi:hypothetical protein
MWNWCPMFQRLSLSPSSEVDEFCVRTLFSYSLKSYAKRALLIPGSYPAEEIPEDSVHRQYQELMPTGKAIPVTGSEGL